MKPLPAEPLPEAFFLPVSEGSCYCLFHAPKGEVLRGSILYLHPFAEELNTTRRIIAQQARALAQLGFGVLQVDLPGCGDSTGEFENASWSSWMDCSIAAAHWLQAKMPGPFWIWGLRTGTLLAAQLAGHFHHDLQRTVHLLFWQPVASGQQVLQQFIRLHSASEWMGARTAGQLSPRQMLDQGQDVEIAGYTLSASLALEMSTVLLVPAVLPKPCSARLVWLEVSSQDTPRFSPSSEKMIADWRKKGWQVEAQIIAEAVFWHTVHANDVPLLCNATTDALLRFGG